MARVLTVSHFESPCYFIVLAGHPLFANQSAFFDLMANQSKVVDENTAAFEARKTNALANMDPASAANTLSEAMGPTLKMKATLFRGWDDLEGCEHKFNVPPDSIKTILEQIKGRLGKPGPKDGTFASTSTFINYPKLGYKINCYAWGDPTNPIISIITYVSGMLHSYRTRTYDNLIHTGSTGKTVDEYFLFVATKNLFDAVSFYDADPYGKINTVMTADSEVNRAIDAIKVNGVPNDGVKVRSKYLGLAVPLGVPDQNGQPNSRFGATKSRGAPRSLGEFTPVVQTPVVQTPVVQTPVVQTNHPEFNAKSAEFVPGSASAPAPAPTPAPTPSLPGTITLDQHNAELLIAKNRVRSEFTMAIARSGILLEGVIKKLGDMSSASSSGDFDGILDSLKQMQGHLNRTLPSNP
jgi:hypothetical protein